MAWPFAKKSKHLTIIDNAIAYVQADNFDEAYDELNDTKDAGLFLFQKNLAAYKTEYMNMKSILGQKSVNKDAALASLHALRRSADALIKVF